MPGTERFDQAAATWDQADRRIVLARDVARAISQQLPLSKGMSVLDFGCGTGLVTLDLAPQVGSISGADTSTGMLKTLGEKAKATGIPVRILPLDEAGTTDLGGPYDLIVSSMTLHHILDVPGLFQKFARQLRPGGSVALADLDEEDGSFHEEGVHIHHRGFRREFVQAWLKDAGFQEIHMETATTTRKEGKDYLVFLATARIG